MYRGWVKRSQSENQIDKQNASRRRLVCMYFEFDKTKKDTSHTGGGAEGAGEAAGAVDDHALLLVRAELHLLEDAVGRAEEHLGGVGWVWEWVGRSGGWQDRAGQGKAGVEKDECIIQYGRGQAAGRRTDVWVCTSMHARTHPLDGRAVLGRELPVLAPLLRRQREGLPRGDLPPATSSMACMGPRSVGQSIRPPTHPNPFIHSNGAMPLRLTPPAGSPPCCPPA